MSAEYDNRYEPDPMGQRLMVRLDRFSEWHALEVRCQECGHFGYITIPTLRRYYSRHHKIVDMEHRFGCKVCRVRGSVRWKVMKQKR